MWLVIGYGSVLHSDDGFGPAVADAVQTQIDPALVEVIVATQLTPGLAEPVSRAAGVIFVDATVEAPAGRLRCVPLAAPVPTASASMPAFTHHCTPELLLESALSLYGRTAPGWLYVVGGQSFELGETLSPVVAQAVLPAAALILDQIGKYGNGTTCTSSAL